jgi:hypothetical protein
LPRKLGDQLRRRYAELRRTQFICRVEPQRGAQHGATRRQRTPRPPNVQRRNMSMPNRLLAAGMFGNAFDREINFDETFGVGHKSMTNEK